MQDHLLNEPPDTRTLYEKLSNQSTNVKLCWAYAFLNGVGFGIWGVAVLSNFIFRLAGDSTLKVGYVEAVQGIAQLISAPLCGYFVDNYSNEAILKISGFMDISLLVILGYYVWTSNDIFPFYVIMGAYGFFTSFEGTAFGTIIANSATSRDRSFVYSIRTFLMFIGNVAGPSISIGLFYYWGDYWELHQLRRVFVSGLGVCFIAGLLLFGFRDKACLGKESEAKEGEAPGEVTQATYWIPIFNIASLLVIMCGAGMSVKFFPIFFQDGLGWSPILVQYLYVTTRLVTAANILFLEWLARYWGRVLTISVSFLISIGALLSMAFYKSTYIIFPIFVLRSSMAQASAPLQKSVLDDYVPKRNRGKWNSAENLLVTFWTGSAAFGGWLIERFSFEFCFIVTAGIYLLGGIMYFPIYRWVRD